MGYLLGVDLGTTYCAAAVHRNGRTEMVTLGNRASSVPSVAYVREDGEVLVGEAAERRAASDPGRSAREFKRRVGDPVPIVAGGNTFAPEALMALQLPPIVRRATERQGEAPEAITLTVPANWSPHRRKILTDALPTEHLPPINIITEPEAAAIHYAQNERIEPGEIVAVYDLGGGTFDAAILRRTDDDFEVLGQPEGIDRLGGIDFDAAVYSHVNRTLDGALDELDMNDPIVLAGLAQLRTSCVEAKEALSEESDTEIPVMLPGLRTEIRMTRAELEAMIRPALSDSVGALRRALASAEVTADDVTVVLLVGGSSRIPLVAQLVGSELGRPVAVDAHPKHAIALGAALAPHPGLANGQSSDATASDSDSSTAAAAAAATGVAGAAAATAAVTPDAQPTPTEQVQQPPAAEPVVPEAVAPRVEAAPTPQAPPTPVPAEVTPPAADPPPVAATPPATPTPAPAEPPAAPAQTPQVAPQPEPAPVQSEAVPVAAAASAVPDGAEPPQFKSPTEGTKFEPSGSSFPLPLVGGIVAVLIAAGIGFFILTSGGDDSGDSVATGDDSAETDEDGSDDGDTDGGGTDEAPDAEEAAAEESTTTTKPETTTTTSTTTTTTTTTTTLPPNPCDELTAPFVCIDDVTVAANGDLEIAFTAEGWTPNLASDHIHFFFNTPAIMDNVLNAGTNGPNRDSWVVWDAPNPATPYSIDQARASGSTEICALIAGSLHTVNIGTGHCTDISELLG